MEKHGNVEKLINKLFDEYEEKVVVTAGAVPFESDDEFGVFSAEAYIARVNLDGKVRGVISEDSVEDALSRAIEMAFDSGFSPVDFRHIENFKDALDELGFDRAVTLLECLGD